jgi:fido (protein-threonine AMPylation protein)
LADRYTYPNDVLINLYNETDFETLEAIERDTAAVIEAELLADGWSGRLDTNFLFHIHRRLFEEVYPWAGEIRAVTLSKGYYSDGEQKTEFARPAYIRPRLDRLMDSLPSRSELGSYDRRKLVGKLTSTFAELNNIHPFREGNGRTQRIFLHFVAQAAGRELHWAGITKERMLVASIAGAEGDPSPISRMFADVIDPERVAALGKAIRHLEKRLPHWNDVYVATTVEGQTYSGQVVAVGGADFMMRVDDAVRTWVGVGHTDDLLPNAPQPEDEIEYTASHWKL